MGMTTLPTLAATDAERLCREAAAYLILVNAFRAEDVEPVWGFETLEPELQPECVAAAPDAGVDGDT